MGTWFSKTSHSLLLGWYIVIVLAGAQWSMEAALSCISVQYWYNRPECKANWSVLVYVKAMTTWSPGHTGSTQVLLQSSHHADGIIDQHFSCTNEYRITCTVYYYFSDAKQEPFVLIMIGFAGKGWKKNGGGGVGGGCLQKAPRLYFIMLLCLLFHGNDIQGFNHNIFLNSPKFN